MFFQERFRSDCVSASADNPTSDDSTKELTATIKNAIKLVEKYTTLDWFDWLKCRVITETNETSESVDRMPMDEFLKIIEYLDVKVFMEERYNKDSEERLKNRSQ